MSAGGPTDSTGEDWARSLASDLLAAALPRRWAHSLGVERRAVTCRSIVAEGELLRQAAVLHDIGYSPGIADTGCHALDGARHLRSLGVDERVVRLVAHHSGADTEARARGLGRELAKFEHSFPLLEDALIYCDLTTTPDGHVTTVDDRLAEMLARHRPESLMGRFIARSSDDLRAATHRIERLLRDAGTPWTAPRRPAPRER